MHGRVEFPHNLLNLFPPGKYGEPHPRVKMVYLRGEYLPLKQDTYLGDVTPRNWPRAEPFWKIVVRKCQTEKQKARTQILLRAFDDYEAAALKFQGIAR